MELFLVQHAESRTKDEDPDKSLTEDGVTAALQIASWAAQAEIQVDEIRHSGKMRAEQTAAILAEALPAQVGMNAVAGINPLDDPAPLAEELQSQQDSVMLIGHLPFLSRLAGILLNKDSERELVAFENAGIVCLQRAGGEWSLRWAMVPRLLNTG